MPIPGKLKTTVIGHKNPDTDSICSAIAYAALKNRLDGEGYEPRRAGELNQETAYVLDRFRIPTPRLLTDAKAKVRDMDIRDISGVSEQITMRKAWETMRDQDITSLAIVREDDTLAGLVTLNDIAVANMDGVNPQALGAANTPVSNILETLRGELLVGDADAVLSKGKVVVGAGSPEVLETAMDAGDIVLLANRYDAQLCAVEMNAALLVICGAPSVAKTILKLAESLGCAVILTPYDTYTASFLINQSVPVGQIMRTELRTFSLTTPVDEVQKTMGQVRYNYFPVLDGENRYVGVISKRNLLNLRRRRLILVDHNEKSQCVDGWEEAEVLEIIDHHRIGSLETNGPVLFRNQPVGCTGTIVYEMYRESGLEPEKPIAGILCCAILSDTLAFRSPTCTSLDRAAAEALARIAGVELETLAEEMFEAGERIAGRGAAELFSQDYKVFVHGDLQFGVGQGSYMSEKNREAAKQLLIPYLQEVVRQKRVDMAFYMLTNIPDGSTELLFTGKGAEDLLSRAFNVEAAGGSVLLPGVVSRKKQFIPAIMNSFSSEAGI